jgi:protein SCO1
MTPAIDAIRRGLLLALPAWAWSGLAVAHDPFGRVEPAQPAPAMALVGDDTQRLDLAQRLSGKVTALQLMFTGCSATCPIQGALFAEVARRLPVSGTALLSLSIDPLNDDARALRGWLQRFGPSPHWHAAAPRVGDVDRLLDFLRGRAAGSDRHTTQVYLFDRNARFVYRTPELPPPAHVTELLADMARRA